TDGCHRKFIDPQITHNFHYIICQTDVLLCVHIIFPYIYSTAHNQHGRFIVSNNSIHKCAPIPSPTGAPIRGVDAITAEGTEVLRILVFPPSVPVLNILLRVRSIQTKTLPANPNFAARQLYNSLLCLAIALRQY
ncbi:hypothetical protein Tcan_01677, partial [Toxocara canis]